MDNFSEQLIRRELTKTDRMKKFFTLYGGILLTLILAVAGFLMLGQALISFILLILAAASGYGTFFLFRNTNVEYEYTFTNGDLDIDKIIAQSKRKEMLTVQVSKFTDFGKYNEQTPEETEDMTVIMVSDNIASHEYYADFQHEEYGNTRLVFSPDEKMLGNINRCLPLKLKISE
ncbi:MAG: hypothetical protein K2I00_08215 [Ruminococcus sp.]|nr:hypothetical protein [Ruminococcus sp.]